MERLDLVNGLAPLAPELSCKEGLHSMERANRAKQAGGKLEEDVVHNGLKRDTPLQTSSSSCVGRIAAVAEAWGENKKTR